MKALFIAALLSISSFSSVWADDIEVDHVWARASTMVSKAGAAFLTITNTGNVDDKLIGAKATVSKKTEIHTHIHDNGIMKMRKVDFIDVPANNTIKLKPGGDHVMFMGLNQPLAENSQFPVTLIFEKAGEKTVIVNVRKLGAMKH